MSQASLFDFEPPPKLTDRIFFAIAPDAEACADIGALTAGLKAQHGMQGRPIAAAKLHCTLCNLGDFAGMPEALLARARQAAALVAPAAVAPVEWPVRELLLLHSHIGQARPYNLLARWSF